MKSRRLTKIQLALLASGFLCKGLAVSPVLPFTWGHAAQAVAIVLLFMFDGIYHCLMPSVVAEKLAEGKAGAMRGEDV